MQKLRTGCGPGGNREPHAAFRLRLRTEMHKHAGLRFAKYRFKRKRGASDPDSCIITLTGNHIPATLHQTLKWSVARHGLTEVDV
jgi:hypothetical protein